MKPKFYNLRTEMKGAALCVKAEQLQAAIEDNFMCDSEPGEPVPVYIEPVEMTEEEFAALGDFEGF